MPEALRIIWAFERAKAISSRKSGLTAVGPLRVPILVDAAEQFQLAPGGWLEFLSNAFDSQGVTLLGEPHLVVSDLKMR